MRKLLLILFFLPALAQAQVVEKWDRSARSGSFAVGKGIEPYANATAASKDSSSYAHKSAWLEIGRDSTSRGMLIPRVVDVDDIDSPKYGNMCYQISDSTFRGFNGVEWIDLAGGGSGGVTLPIEITDVNGLADTLNTFVSNDFMVEYVLASLSQYPRLTDSVGAGAPINPYQWATLYYLDNNYLPLNNTITVNGTPYNLKDNPSITVAGGTFDTTYLYTVLDSMQRKVDTNDYDATKHWVGQQGYITGFTEIDPLSAHTADSNTIWVTLSQLNDSLGNSTPDIDSTEAGYGLLEDGNLIYVDTSEIATQYDISQLANYQFDYGLGIGAGIGYTSVYVDTATLSAYYLRIKDSIVKYVTPTQLAAYTPPAPTLGQVLGAGDTATNRNAIIENNTGSIYGYKVQTGGVGKAEMVVRGGAGKVTVWDAAGTTTSEIAPDVLTLGNVSYFPRVGGEILTAPVALVDSAVTLGYNEATGQTVVLERAYRVTGTTKNTAENVFAIPYGNFAVDVKYMVEDVITTAAAGGRIYGVCTINTFTGTSFTDGPNGSGVGAYGPGVSFTIGADLYVTVSDTDPTNTKSWTLIIKVTYF